MKDYEIVTTGEPVRLVRCGDYIAASDGKIYKMNWKRTGKMREVKQHKDRFGYLLFRFNEKIIVSHRFIAACFLPKPGNLHEVNHKNEIKSDNRVENLEWCDRKYNVNYGTRNERIGRSLINRPDYSKPVSQFTKEGHFVATYPSAHEAARQTGVSFGNISNCCLGRSKTAGGYIWRRAN